MNIAELNINFAAISPALVLIVTAIVVMLVDAYSEEGKTRPLAFLSLVGVGVAALVAMLLSRQTFTGFSDMVVHDSFAAFGEFIVAISAGLTLLSADRDHANHNMRQGEYYMLLLASAAGMAFLMTATDLVMLFLGLELMSIPIYALAGSNRRSVRSGESALKYFVLGAFATGLLLYGSALLFGVTGSTNYADIAARGELFGNDVYYTAGAALVLSALAFKVSAVPFHMWTPDVYQGAPTSITGYMGAGVKAAAFVAFARILFTVFGDAGEAIYPVLWALAAVSMVVGNVLALVQSNVKRMLAYSSIAHAGYLLIALAAGSEGAISAMLFYLVVYGISNLGAFAATIAISGKEDAEDIESWAGLASRRPYVAFAMMVCMLSLAGIPPTAGFLGKFYLFKEAVERGLVNLAVIGVLASAVGVYYYLRVIVYMYMKKSATGEEGSRTRDAAVSVGLGIATLAIAFLGLMPGRLLEIARNSVIGLF